MAVYATMFVLLFCVMIRMSVALTWTTEILSTTSCEGQDKLLVWNYSTGENDIIRQLHWYYNRTTPICFKSESYGFNMAPLYEGRVEQYGSYGIRLKNLSLIDTGEYTLYLKLVEEQKETLQTIFLTVHGTPRHHCKPDITIPSKSILSCSAKSCGRAQSSTEWRIVGRQDPLSTESNLTVSSSWNGKRVLCCPHGPNMECHNGNQHEFCASTQILFTDEVTPFEKDIPDTKGSKIHSVISPNYEQKAANMDLMIVALIVSIFVIIIVLFLIYCYSRRLKLFVARNQKLKPDEEACTKVQPIQSAAISTDPELCESSSNQKLQIINNINLDSVILKGMFESHPLLTAEICAMRKENEFLQSQLNCLEHLIQVPDIQKNVDASYILRMEPYDNGNNMNTSTVSSKYEDAVSEIVNNI